MLTWMAAAKFVLLYPKHPSHSWIMLEGCAALQRSSALSAPLAPTVCISAMSVCFAIAKKLPLGKENAFPFFFESSLTRWVSMLHCKKNAHSVLRLSCFHLPFS